MQLVEQRLHATVMTARSNYFFNVPRSGSLNKTYRKKDSLTVRFTTYRNSHELRSVYLKRPYRLSRVRVRRAFVSAIQFHKSTQKANLALLSMGAAVHGAAASMEIMGSIKMSISFVLSAPCDFVWPAAALSLDEF